MYRASLILIRLNIEFVGGCSWEVVSVGDEAGAGDELEVEVKVRYPVM